MIASLHTLSFSRLLRIIGRIAVGLLLWTLGLAPMHILPEDVSSFGSKEFCRSAARPLPWRLT